MARFTAEIRIRDSERIRLFVWELMMLVDKMRVEGSPHAEELERIVDRLTDGGDDEHEPAAP